MTPIVSVVVPCRNETDCIGRCIESLLNQNPVPGGFEVIVADGMSDDGTREILKQLAVSDARLRVVDNQLRITPCGMNCGIRSSRGRWIAIMGSHNHYAPDYLVRCLEAALKTGADNVGGGMFSEGDAWLQRAIAAAHHSPFSVGGARWHSPDYEGPADTVFGGFYRREVFDRIGLFDEEFVRNQDDELNLRLTRAGGKIWQSPDVKSWYHPRASIPALFRQYSQYGYWKVRVIQKHKRPASWRHLIPGAFLLILLLLFTAASLCLLTSAYWPGVSFLGRLCLWGLVALTSTYGLCVLGASLLAATKTEWKFLPVLPLIFGCYHLGYGYGFLHGVWDLAIRRTRPGSQFVGLTRTASLAGKPLDR